MTSPPSPDVNDEIAALIATLHDAERRLEELTRGEVDTVAGRNGQPFLLRRAQDRIRQGQADRQAAILNALPANLALLDGNGVIVSVNDKWRRFARANGLGQEGDGIGCNYLEVCEKAVGQDASEAHEAAAGIRSVLDGRDSAYSIEYSCHSPDERRWFQLTATPLADEHHKGAVVMHVDVTARKQAEEVLRESEERFSGAFENFQQLANNITDAFWIRSADMREVHYISPAFERIWGRSTESLYADPQEWSEFIVSEDRERVLASFSALTKDAPTLDVEYRIIRSDGEVRWVRTRGFQVRDDDGKLIRNTGIVTDITEKHRMEGQLRQAQKMEAVGQLAAGVAHEFNNLLQALMSMSAIIRFRARTPEVVAMGTEMESLIKRGAGLTQQLLLFSRHRPIEKATVDINEQVRKGSELLGHLIPETVRIVVKTSSERLFVDGDAGQIQQVILNLAINARDAMTGGGTLTLRTGMSGDEVFHEVEDTGQGMGESTLRRLFEPFFTTKEPGKGTGLGLAVAHGIVEQHGGRIEVRSRRGEGSCFRVLLPASRREDVPAAAVTAGPGLSMGAGRVLLVEDDPGVRAGISFLLAMIGYEVITASSGEEALALVLDPPPAFLLSDVTLPGIAGPAVAECLVERFPALAVVLMSGYVEDEKQTTGWHFLQKPFELEDLARKMRVAAAA